jgi:hypothetical protein
MFSLAEQGKERGLLPKFYELVGCEERKYFLYYIALRSDIDKKFIQEGFSFLKGR